MVYLVAVEQGKLPHDRCRHDPEQLEEERRLMFVGLTRAQELATLSYARYRDFRGQRAPTIPSQFLMELPRDAMTVLETGAPKSYPAIWDPGDEDVDGVDDYDDISFDPSDFEAPETQEAFVAALQVDD